MLRRRISCRCPDGQWRRRRRSHRYWHKGRRRWSERCDRQKLILSPAQRQAIYEEVSKDKSKVAPKDFSPVIGGDVPPMIKLYALPDDAVASIPAAKIYKYTMVENKVVVVDPTKMRVIDVIGPPGTH
jgi:hypothetical protein